MTEAITTNQLTLSQCWAQGRPAPINEFTVSAVEGTGFNATSLSPLSLPFLRLPVPSPSSVNEYQKLFSYSDDETVPIQRDQMLMCIQLFFEILQIYKDGQSIRFVSAKVKWGTERPEGLSTEDQVNKMWYFHNTLKHHHRSPEQGRASKARCRTRYSVSLPK